jgi:hypothetical protein
VRAMRVDGKPASLAEALGALDHGFAGFVGS